MTDLMDKIPSRLRDRLIEDHGCLIWTGATNQSGYGNAWWDDRSWLVHRLVFVHVFGPIPEGLAVCHACDNPPCANPQHLMLGTNLANMIDAERKGRIVRRYGCQVDGCDGDHLARGYCGRHYQRIVNHGDPHHLSSDSREAKAARSHCHRGHPFDDENTLIRSNGTRQCRACARLRHLRRKSTA